MTLEQDMMQCVTCTQNYNMYCIYEKLTYLQKHYLWINYSLVMSSANA